VGFAIDISRRKEREQAMEHACRYLQAITDSMGEGVFTLDPDGCLVYVNQAASAMLGWTLPAMSGRPIEALLGVPQPGDAAPGDCLLPMRRACHEGEVARVPDAVFTRADGVGLSVRYTASPLAGEHGVGGCVVVFEDITKAKADDERMQRDVERLAWLGHVQEALSEDRFVLHAQPIADARTGEVVQRELLLRMLAPPSSNGAPALIAPGEYLPVAEEYGLIGEVDRWVVSRAAEIAARGIAVQCNVSGHSVSDPSFVDHIRDEVAGHGADPATIVFEITETAIISDEPAARAFVERLHALGCKIALDDFGTGYGAFSYLKQLPIDYLKIDIEFVRDAGIDPASRGVVRAIVELARGIGISTVAEGVEDEETLILMRNLRVDYVQGFHIGRPAPLVTGEFGSQ
jgi:PAS domain S-box-containing protein